MNRHKLGMVFAVAWMTCLAASAATVRGKLLLTVSGRQIPAGGFSVTLFDNQKNKRSFAVNSDSSGMYTFQNVGLGDYTVQVWRPGKSPLGYRIQVGTSPLVDVAPFILPDR